MKRISTGVLAALLVLQGIVALVPHNHGVGFLDSNPRHLVAAALAQRAELILDSRHLLCDEHDSCLACAITPWVQAASIATVQLAAPDAQPAPAVPFPAAASRSFITIPRQRGPPRLS